MKPLLSKETEPNIGITGSFDMGCIGQHEITSGKITQFGESAMNDGWESRDGDGDISGVIGLPP